VVKKIGGSKPPQKINVATIIPNYLPEALE
jgi:hypothetical protein